jgi:hypothetical protein
LIKRPEASFALAESLRSPEGAPLGDVFSFLSGLYFRGKLAYARAFADPPAGLPGALVITTGRGLLPLGTRVTAADLDFFASIPIDLREPRYREPLEEALRALAEALPSDARLVLLGSISTPKYLELLLESVGERICYPEVFVGMGDMRRGSVMLKAAEAGVELAYTNASGAALSRPRRRHPVASIRPLDRGV